jgi:hypothetical protein
MRLTAGTPWYGWPDFSTDLFPVSDATFQPPMELMIRTGYPELAALIDHRASNLDTPDLVREQLRYCAFKSQSGAAKLDIVPGVGLLKQFRDDAIVTLSGDRAPFATSGQQLLGAVGYRIVRVNLDPGKHNQYSDFIRNTSGKPASWMGGSVVGLERPCDVKFAPDGTLYILDMGRMRVENGKEKVSGGTGRLFKLVSEESLQHATTQSSTTRKAS